MKAIVISRLGGPEVLEVLEISTPTPGEGTELVQVRAGGLNFADVMSARGGYPGTPEPPLIAGREFSGIHDSDGQRVMGYMQYGAFAQYATPLQTLFGRYRSLGLTKKAQRSQSITSLRTLPTGKRG